MAVIGQPVSMFRGEVVTSLDYFQSTLIDCTVVISLDKSIRGYILLIYIKACFLRKGGTVEMQGITGARCLLVCSVIL